MSNWLSSIAIRPFSPLLQACSWTFSWVDPSSPGWGSPESMVVVYMRPLLTRMQSSQSLGTWPQHLGKLN